VTQTELRRMHKPAAEGERISFMGMELVWKITSAMSGGSLVSFVQIGPPGTGVPMHVHRRDDEYIYLIDGELVFRLGDETFEVHAGDVVHMPKGEIHGFRIAGDRPAHILFTLALAPEADYEGMFAAFVGKTTEDFDEICAIASRNGADFVVPPVLP
jgi:quercetin dioxygenase-like cupin family protein